MGIMMNIANVASGMPITALTQNHIIDAVNRLSSIPVSPPSAWSGHPSNTGAQAITAPAFIADDAAITAFGIGAVVVITGRIENENDRSILSGATGNFGVIVREKQATDAPGIRIAVVTATLDDNGRGRVAVSGCALASVERLATSPELPGAAEQLTGSLLSGKTVFSIGEGAGDVDIVWEENEDTETHYAYVMIPGRSDRGVPAINSSGDEIPPYSALEVSGTDSSDRATVVKPTENDLFQVLFSPAYPIPTGLPFMALAPDEATVVTNDTPAIGDELGTATGQWYLKKDNTGFKMLSGAGDVARVRIQGGGSSLPLVATVAAPSGGNVSVKFANADGSLAGDAFTVKVLPYEQPAT